MADSNDMRTLPDKDGQIVGRELTINEVGLKPFPEFEKYLSDLLRRIPEADRKVLLEKMYALAGQRIIAKTSMFGLQYIAADARKRRALIQRVRTHVKGIRKIVADLRVSDDDEINTRLCELDRSLGDYEKGLVESIHPDLKTPTEKIVPRPELFVKADAGYHHGLPAGLHPKANDEWLAKALYESFPRPPLGKRSLFSRNKVIKKVLDFVGLPTSERRVVKLRKPRRSRKTR